MSDPLSNEFQEHLEFLKLIEVVESISSIRAKYNITKPSPEIECCKEELGLLIVRNHSKVLSEINSYRAVFREFLQDRSEERRVGKEC